MRNNGEQDRPVNQGSGVAGADSRGHGFGRGFHPGGKQKKGTEARSARLLAKGVGTYAEIQAYLEALGRDVMAGQVGIKEANFQVALMRTRIGLALQIGARGGLVDISPVSPASAIKGTLVRSVDDDDAAADEPDADEAGDGVDEDAGDAASVG